MTNQAKLSSWASNIAPSPTLAVDSKAKELKAAGEDVCGFGAGEPDFDTPEFIKEACIQAIREGKTKYAPAPGIPALREALAAHYRTHNGVEGVTAAQIVVSPGGKYSCYLAILAVVSPGDEVIIPAPYWVSYPEMVKLAGGVPKTVFAGIESEFKISPEQLRAAITPKTRMVIINSPSNPTGAIYSPEELKALTEVAIEAGIYIMSDEIYEHLLYDGVKHVSPASFSKEAADSVITVAGFSKTFSMTGWRLGTLMAPLPVAKAVANLQSQTSSNATTFAQYGALAAMQNWDQSMEAVQGMLKVFDARRLRLLEGLRAIPGVECARAQGAFYLFPNIEKLGLSDSEFAARILEEEKVAVVPGSAFGADGYIRLSYATSDEVIDKGIERLARFCAKLG
ncbi:MULTISPECIES: pyridoxal phosphate-dependent aminotransferase [unclassified Lentimonas]|uniref:pyridoxal phosphate-dependent aminotransferase n=1 Tax=unclassified Lentimonas TaxID=2630993 RepID=UPI00132A84C5|nr:MULTISPECIES: pyridoxal phosphate-dependent aminotransferase [unclassified Lentimonas]CAA6679758.1 Aspartate aminotransferase (EC [Lentimonas sp. CC4]CAA6685730.1 Aspartate aminotransferase (EC [Lentimonas sp. CC6]CAA7077173.1 Aspartate aminotransferase (EC [Lentimonas sp. CC4]CAA7168741.1 Aspartate aminotransferase (EC [Lentimonas sp. CC21]CAA7180889.1 Aspartate aminotransferase (EC [Lentimonas sp. CC8]